MSDTSEKLLAPLVGGKGLRRPNNDRSGDRPAVRFLPVDLRQLSTLQFLALAAEVETERQRRNL